jgi:hypothetical protein
MERYGIVAIKGGAVDRHSSGPPGEERGFATAIPAYTP